MTSEQAEECVRALDVLRRVLCGHDAQAYLAIQGALLASTRFMESVPLSTLLVLLDQEPMDAEYHSSDSE
jgi:hypothetical protein